MDKFSKFARLIAIFSVLTSFLTVHANVEDHFKKAPGKADNHHMQGVDFIYMINLDQRPEKFEKSNQQLNPFGIFPYRFSAVNGWELTLEDINDVGVKLTKEMETIFRAPNYTDRRATSYLDSNFVPTHSLLGNFGQVYFCHCMARGTIGIVLSHLSVLQDAYDSGYETIWVMEDDVEVISDPNKISKRIAELDKKVGKGNWDILFTDKDIRDKNGEYIPCYSAAFRPNFSPSNPERFKQKEQIDKHFWKTGARFGAHSMIVRRSGMEKILNYFKKYQVFLPYDIDFYMPNGIQLYTVAKDIVSNMPKSLTDNGRPGYLKKKD